MAAFVAKMAYRNSSQSEARNFLHIRRASDLPVGFKYYMNCCYRIVRWTWWAIAFLIRIILFLPFCCKIDDMTDDNKTFYWTGKLKPICLEATPACPIMRSCKANVSADPRSHARRCCSRCAGRWKSLCSRRIVSRNLTPDTAPGPHLGDGENTGAVTVARPPRQGDELKHNLWISTLNEISWM